MVLIYPIMILSVARVVGGAAINWVLFTDFYDIILPIRLKIGVVVVRLLGVIFR